MHRVGLLVFGAVGALLIFWGYTDLSGQTQPDAPFGVPMRMFAIYLGIAKAVAGCFMCALCIGLDGVIHAIGRRAPRE